MKQGFEEGLPMHTVGAVIRCNLITESPSNFRCIPLVLASLPTIGE